MLTNPRIAGYLSQALSHEMSVVQQYLTQSNLCGCWDMGAECDYFRREAGEELEHAGKIIRHMLTLGLAPNATRLEPVRPGRDMAEMLTFDWHLEEEAVRLYDDALRYAQRCRDEASIRLFADLLADEQAHLQELERMLTELREALINPSSRGALLAFSRERSAAGRGDPVKPGRALI